MIMVEFGNIYEAIGAAKKAYAAVDKGPLPITLAVFSKGISTSDLAAMDYVKSIINNDVVNGIPDAFLWGHSRWGESDKVV